MSKNVSEVLGASMSKVREMVDANTVVGDPIVLGEDLTLIPISKISFALASGGADFARKNGAASGSFGGGAGCGVKITPVGMICLQGRCGRTDQRGAARVGRPDVPSDWKKEDGAG